MAILQHFADLRDVDRKQLVVELERDMVPGFGNHAAAPGSAFERHEVAGVDVGATVRGVEFDAGAAWPDGAMHVSQPG